MDKVKIGALGFDGHDNRFPFTVWLTVQALAFSQRIAAFTPRSHI
jgi:hypothetical protein